ncbi:hypothetical protein ONR75_11025 [Rhodopseudomonas sp. P2A-2r]|uniref:hypothetical protein n=1 Tax=Rhodopseudomonas sp. P2A-2r TaxID=2991972 RepID=UPI0022341414|nr:hypothetical protein [Rhodopseudomonas sp. P2A-2r]UZE51092.1 hypothetical protein ONR75_11025 [Rhodopseudomonas sp. P2A-2r]
MDAALSPHFFNVGQRRELLAGDQFNGKTTARDFAPQTGYRHSAARKSDLCGFRKPQRLVALDFLCLGHRFRLLDGVSLRLSSAPECRR